MLCDSMEDSHCEEGEQHSEHNDRWARFLLAEMDVQRKLEHICISHILKISCSPSKNWPKLVKSIVSVLHPELNLNYAVLLVLLCKTPSCGQSLEDESFTWTSPELVDEHPLPFLSLYLVSCTCSVLVAVGPHCRRQWHCGSLRVGKRWCLLFSKLGWCTGAGQWDQPAFQLPEAPTAAGTLTDLSVLSHY